MKTPKPQQVCHICGKHLPPRSMRPWISVRPGVSELIAHDHEGWADGKFICSECLTGYRRRYVEDMLEGRTRRDLGA